MKTIFITSFHGLISRVFACGLLEYLKKDSNVRIIIFAPDFKIDYFRKEFPNVAFVGIKPRKSNFLHKLSFVLLNTKSMYLIRRSSREYKNFPIFLMTQLISLLGSFKFVRKLYRLVNYYFNKPIFSHYFEKYNPDIVLSMDVKTILDNQILIEAKKRKIKTIGMIRSWDSITAKGLVRTLPDKLVVHNEIIKKEAMKYADMKAENIFVSGIPHYDAYLTERTGREEFFKKIGADSNRPLVLFAPLGDKFSDMDYKVLEYLKDYQVLVRIPPTDTVNFKHDLIDYTGVNFEIHSKNNEMSYNDLLHLADTLYYSNVVLTSSSTICIDAIVFNKPVVFLGFDGKGYWEGIRNYYDYNHAQNILIGGEIAKDEKELIKLIDLSLKNPSYKEEERKKVAQEQCWKLDGKSSQRLANYVLG